MMENNEPRTSRSLSEVAKVLLVEFESTVENYGKKVNGSLCIGICKDLYRIHATEEEKQLIRDELNKTLLSKTKIWFNASRECNKDSVETSKHLGYYYWHPLDRQVRIDWIKSLIK